MRPTTQNSGANGASGGLGRAAFGATLLVVLAVLGISLVPFDAGLLAQALHLKAPIGSAGV